MSPKKSPQKIDINSDKEKFFNSMIENSPFLILRNKKDATITYVNKAIEKFFGIQKEDIIGKKWLSNISKEQKEEIKNYLKEASEKLITFQHNVTYNLKNNEQKIIQWITQPLLDDNGNFLGELQAIGIDITDKHFYQKQLTEAQDNLSLFFKQSLDGFFIAETDEPIEWNDKCDKEKSLRLFYHDFKITQVNQAFLNQYNAKEKDMIGLAPADFFVHNYKYGLEICKKILDSGYITLVTDERKFDGSPIWIEAQYNVLKNEQGLIFGLFGIQRDITEKVKLEKELKENELIFRNTFDINPHPIWIYDIDTTQILSVNNATVQVLGYSKDELLNMKLKDFTPKEDWDILEKEINEVKKDIKLLRVNTWKHTKKDGSILIFELRASGIKFRNKNARIVVATDITEKLENEKSLKESEESYKELFNSLTQAIYILDNNFLFITVNEGAEKMYGYKKEEFVGRTPEFLSAPGRNDLQFVLSCFNKTFKTGETTNFEFWGLRKNGEVFPKDVTQVKSKYFGKDVIIAIGHDITERKNFEQSIELSKENFKSIFNQFHDSIIIHDFDGNIIEANQKTLELYNYSYEQIKALKIFDLSAEDNMQKFRLRKIWDKVKIGNKLDFEWIAKNSKGEKFDVQVSLQKNIWSDNEVIFAIIKDLRELRKIEKALIQYEESYLDLFNSITDLIFILNYDATIIDFNKSVINTLGFEKNDLLNKSFSFISVPIKNNYTEFLEKISHTYYTGESTNYELWIHNKIGTKILTDIKLTLSKSGDKFVVIALARDITEKGLYQAQIKESEEHFRQLYENSSIGIFRTTIDGKIIFANPALVKMFGFNSFDEFKDLKVQEKFYPQKEKRQEFIKQLLEKQELKGIEYELLDKNGNILFVREYSRIIKNSKGEFEYIEGTLENITEKKNYEQSLIESETRLKELNATKDKFFSIIAHDLRSPFQGLLGISNILTEEDMTNEEKNYFFQRLHEGIKNLHNLIEELLTWSRVQRGTIEYEPTKNNLTQDVEDIVSIMKDLAFKKNIMLSEELEDNLICFYDKNMIDSVVRNLISNAIKFTPSLGNIFVKLYKTDTEVIFSIKDTGIGMTKEDVQKLFRLDTPFTRRGTNDEAGTGLGLILCKEFINKHNGNIWVESEVNKGTTFSFSLPLN